jgi:hypothetical protein
VKNQPTKHNDPQARRSELLRAAWTELHILHRTPTVTPTTRKYTKFVPVFTYVMHHDVWWSEGTVPLILHLYEGEQLQNPILLRSASHSWSRWSDAEKSPWAFCKSNVSLVHRRISLLAYLVCSTGCTLEAEEWVKDLRTGMGTSYVTACCFKMFTFSQ